MVLSGAKFLKRPPTDAKAHPSSRIAPKDYGNPHTKLRGRRDNMSFVGSYTHTLDAKKRVFIPAKFREELGCEFYITRKFAPYLSVYTAKDWFEYVDKISALPESVASKVQDYILAYAQKCVIDSSGRIVLNDKLMDHAKIDKNVVFTGAGHQIRIWAEEIWQKQEESLDLEELRQTLASYGL